MKTQPAEQVLELQHDHYAQLGVEITEIEEQIEDLIAQRTTLEGERSAVAEELAEAAQTDAELVRWSNNPAGAERLTAMLNDLHPAIIGFRQWKRTEKLGGPGDVRFMPVVEIPYAEKVDDFIVRLADALVAFAGRFGGPVPAEAQVEQPTWIQNSHIEPGRFPIALYAISKDQPPRWWVQYDPSTSVALLTDTDDYYKPYAGTLPQVLVQISRKLWDINH